MEFKEGHRSLKSVYVEKIGKIILYILYICGVDLEWQHCYPGVSQEATKGQFRM